MDYIFHISIIILFYVMLSQSLVLVSGYARMISLAQAAFYGIGAYTTAILSVKFGLPFIVNLPIAIFICGVIAAFISTISLRTVDDYFIIITLGIQVVVFSLMDNLMGLTKGPLGIQGIPPIELFKFVFQSKLSYLILTFCFTIIIFLLLRFIIKSPFGLILKGLSEDEIFIISIGKNVNAAKVLSFTIGAMLAAVPGVLYAHYSHFIDPSSFTIDESIFVLSLVIIGGMRSLSGAAIASVVLVILPEALRFIGVPSNIAANVRQIIYGFALVVIMFKYSKGINSKTYYSTVNFKAVPALSGTFRKLKNLFKK